MDPADFQQIIARLEAVNSTLQAMELKLNVVDMRVDLMETRFDYRFDLIDEHLAFITGESTT